MKKIRTIRSFAHPIWTLLLIGPALGAFFMQNAFAEEKDIAALITDLGDDKYEVRESATLKLLKLDLAAINPLRKQLVTETDLEVRHRASRIISVYFSPAYTDVGMIWNLPRKRRIVDGEDIALKYFWRARDRYNEASPRHIAENNWGDWIVSQLATKLYLHDILLDTSEDRRAEVEVIKGEMSGIKSKMDEVMQYCSYSEECYMYFDTPNPPQIAEDFIRELAETNNLPELLDKE